MQIAFTLSMPTVGSWNGKWTGADRLHCLIRSFTGKKKIEQAERLLEKGSWHYSWGDGWGASICAEKVDGREAARKRRKSSGFCGYDWMVDTIIRYGKPMATHELKKHLEAQEVTS